MNRTSQLRPLSPAPFNHLTKQAVGYCKSCGRSLCHDCIASKLTSVACCDRCEEKVQAIDAFMAKAVHAKYSTTKVANFVGAMMMAAVSVMLWNIPELTSYGIVMRAFSVVLFINAARMMLLNNRN